MFEGSVLWREYEGGCVEAARARVRCASANIEVPSPVLTAHGASYHNY